MMKNEKALALLLRAQLPQLSESRMTALLSCKHRCVVAMQRYDTMSREELEDVEVLLHDFPTLQVAFLEARALDPEARRKTRIPALPPMRFFSCLIDSTCEFDPVTCKRKPRLRVELPGSPILGDGKADNQNCALPFTRGTVLQMIDANQEGYLEESLKICCALREFEVGERVFGTRPAVVGFREHIFSGLGSLGEFAASSELVFGTLVQRTMAYPLYARYHYGHPDMLSKTAMIAQGGVSKATKGLNLSEDVFTGMDAVLRGQTVVHREYYQVGKGRDMGFTSILNFFVKLSKGTARMTTTRQAHRLGTRLSVGRLLGFYYAHAGYYVGQLHWYHSTYGVLSLIFLGALCEGTGLLPAAANSVAVLANLIYGPLFGLFLASSLLPLSAVLLVERGLITAVLHPLRLVLTGSAFYFIFQSRCVGHQLSDEYAFGGASYLATGRGLGIHRNDFKSLYCSFAVPAFYPGLELMCFLMLAPFACPTQEIRPSVWVFGLMTPLALLYSPALFNPQCFELRTLLVDLVDWFAWLADTGPSGWLQYHKRLCDKKPGTHVQAMLLPSKELLLSIPLLIVSFEAMQAYGWGSWQLAALMLPPTPAVGAVTLALLKRLCRCCSRRRRGEVSELPVAAGLVCGLCLAAEALLLHSVAPALPVPHWITLAATRYFSLRWVCNSLVYVQQQSAKLCCDHIAPVRCLLELSSSLVTAYAVLADLVMGLTLQVPVLLLALVPGIRGLHLRFLFNTSSGRLKESAELQESGTSMLEHRLRRQGSSRPPPPRRTPRSCRGSEPDRDGRGDSVNKALLAEGGSPNKEDKLPSTREMRESPVLPPSATRESGRERAEGRRPSSRSSPRDGRYDNRERDSYGGR